MADYHVGKDANGEIFLYGSKPSWDKHYGEFSTADSSFIANISELIKTVKNLPAGGLVRVWKSGEVRDCD